MTAEHLTDWSRYRHSVTYLEALLSLEPERRLMRPPTDSVGAPVGVRVGEAVGLSRCRRLLDFLGHPERDLRFVHVTGTSGKGSTVMHLHRLLHLHGRRVGSYVSPHISTPLERIMLGDGLIPLASWLDGIDKLKPFVQEEYRSGPFGLPSFHELLFALALETFRAHEVELALIEVGIGGRLDSTNLIPAPLVAIVTEVGLDHQELLGPDIPSIARDKAGIFKPGSLALTGTLRPEAEAELLAEARRVGIPLWRLGPEETRAVTSCGAELTRASAHEAPLLGLAREAGRLWLETPRGSIEVPASGLMGEHQQRNAALALCAALEVAAVMGFELHPERVVEGFATVFLPGRLERVILEGGRRLWLDMAHNGDKIEGLCRHWEALEGRGGGVVVSVASDKDVEAILSRLGRTFEHLYVTRPLAVPRKLFGPWALLERARGMGLSASAWIDPREAVEAAWRAHEGRVVVTGSTYLVGDLRRWFSPEHEVVSSGRLLPLEPSSVGAILSSCQKSHP
ncbi:MAG: bifunctional folylpolyglutamate synthase/dihydrofolate synthase [Myxococcota bacterium]